MAYVVLRYDVQVDEDRFLRSRGIGKFSDLVRRDRHGTITVADGRRGEVVELSVIVLSTKTRPARPDEMKDLSDALGGDVESRTVSAVINALKEERSKLARQVVAEKEINRDLRNDAEAKTASILSFMARDIGKEDRRLLAASLEIHIEELAMTQNLDGYAHAKDVYKRLTGRSWIDDE